MEYNFEDPININFFNKKQYISKDKEITQRMKQFVTLVNIKENPDKKIGWKIIENDRLFEVLIYQHDRNVDVDTKYDFLYLPIKVEKSSLETDFFKLTKIQNKIDDYKKESKFLSSIPTDKFAKQQINIFIFDE